VAQLLRNRTSQARVMQKACDTNFVTRFHSSYSRLMPWQFLVYSQHGIFNVCSLPVAVVLMPSCCWYWHYLGIQVLQLVLSCHSNSVAPR